MSGMKDIPERLRERAKVIFYAQKIEAWGPREGTRRAAAMWPQSDKDWRALEHNPVADIDLAMAAARALHEIEQAAEQRGMEAAALIAYRNIDPQDNDSFSDGWNAACRRTVSDIRKSYPLPTTAEPAKGA